MRIDNSSGDRITAGRDAKKNSLLMFWAIAGFVVIAALVMMYGGSFRADPQGVEMQGRATDEVVDEQPD